jgi:tetratricopeptide (TPR) repeat protein
MHLSILRHLALAALLVLGDPFDHRARAQSGDVRTLTMRVAADDTYRTRPQWEVDLRNTVQVVSDIYEKQFQVRFVILDVVPFTAPPGASLGRRASPNRLDRMIADVPVGDADLLIGFSGGPCEDRVRGVAQAFGRVALIMATCPQTLNGRTYGAESVLSHEIAHLFGAFHPAINVPSVMVLGGGPPDLFDDQNRRVIRLTRSYDFRGGIMTLDEATRRAWRAIYAEGHQRTGEVNPLVYALEKTGLELARSGRVAEGEAAVREAIRIDQLLASPHVTLGFIYAQQGRLPEAAREFGMAAGLEPNDPRPRSELGLILLHLGRTNEAASQLQIALAIDPDMPRARAGRCAVLALRDRLDEAILDCTEAIRLAPNEAWLFTRRGEVYRRKGDLDRAIEDYDAALRIDRNHARALNGRGLVRLMKGDHAGAQADLEAARSMSPEAAD